MAEDSFEKRPEITGELPSLRVAVGKPSLQEISLVMKSFPDFRRHLLLDKYDGDRKTVLDELSQQKLLIEQNKAVRLSRPALCVYFIGNDLYTQSWNASEEAFKRNDTRYFRFAYDFATGIKFALVRTMIATGEMDKIDDMSAKVISDIGETAGWSVGDQADEYLKRRKEQIELIELLRKDPSGFLLMDDSVSRAKIGLPSDIGTNQAKEYLLAGVETTRDLYKRVYEIAAPLYPEKQSE